MFAVYGGIKLRKKKASIESVVEHLETPRIVVMKDDAKISVHRDSWDLWDMCGLEPYAGAKVIRWVCLYPEFVSISTFFSDVTDKWKANGFGYFEPVPILTHTGYFPINKNDGNIESRCNMDLYDSYLPLLSIWN
jgi:hypothetical protein